MIASTQTSTAAAPLVLRWDPDALRPFPAIALKALKLMSGTDTSLLELCNLIRSDPAISGAILRLANSPLVGFPKTVTSVLQASMLLGFRQLRSLVITLGLKAYLHDACTPLIRSCWRHSVACALIAERSAKWSFLDNDFAHTAGILHDIGRIALATLMPDSYLRVVEHGANRPQDLLQVEWELCGIDHNQAGSSLVTAWNLPDAFLETTACHHTPEQCTLAGAASLIPPSCALADALGFALIRYESPRSYAEILNGFPKPAQERFPADAQEFAADIAQEIKLIESA